MAQIDFQPAEIGAIETRGADLVLAFPCQPLYDENTQHRGFNSYYRCELVLGDGRLLTDTSPRVPAYIDNLWVEYGSRGRGFHLPIGFDEAGPVEVRVGSTLEESGGFAWRPVAIGTSVSLRVLEKVRDVLHAGEP